MKFDVFWRLRDHPRVCGEQPKAEDSEAYKKGSPPRVRGTVQHCFESQVDDRITPACAGNRGIHNLESPTSQDHPRVCGEQHMTQEFFTWTMGSPPRVRGTDMVVAEAAAGIRITPACAGNSPLCLIPLDSLKDHPRVCGEQADNNVCMAAKAGSPPRVRGTGHRSAGSR